jgi:ATP-dependent RNA helicase DeaD
MQAPAAAGFDGLGLGDAGRAAAAQAAYEVPTALQRAVVPVIRRGGNVVLHAATGSGVTGAWALPLIDRLAIEPPSDAGTVRVLVVVPTVDRAAALAATVARMAGAAGVAVRAMARGWATGPADVRVGAVDVVAAAIAASELKLDALVAFVLEGLSAVLPLHGDAVLETLMASVPRDAQRVVTTAERTREADRFADAMVRRAIHWPARPAAPGPAADAAPAGHLSYLVVPEAGKLDALARLLSRPRDRRPVVVVRTVARARAVAAELALRGYGPDDAAGADVVAAAAAPAGALIALDAPFDAASLAAFDARDAIAIITPHEVAHLRQIATEAGVRIRALPREPADDDPVGAYRAGIRRAVAEEDLEAQRVLLAPLFEEFAAEEVAAALSVLVRRRTPAPVPAPVDAAAQRPARGAPSPFVRLFVSAGQKDGVRPADIVGALAGEAGAKAEQIGRIDIRDTFSVVEVEPGLAETAIRSLNGRSLRGRSLRVDYDRHGGGPPARRGGAGGRRAPRREG